jgi:uncharacterized protein (DUF1697 family)
MHTYISLLRGINVSGKNRIAMPALQAMYIELGYSNVRTYVQSGNVVFDTLEQAPPILARQIEVEIEGTFSYEVPVIVRRPADFQRILATNPFLRRDGIHPDQLYVTFIASTASMVVLSDLPNPNADGDEYAMGERELYLFCPNGYGRTKLNNNFFERKLKLVATTRNWKTVIALEEMGREGYEN